MPKRAGYSRGAIIEKNSITVLRSLLPNKIIPKVEENDKTPNSDGFLILLGDDLTGVARIEVQVKALPKRYQTKPRYKVKLSLFDFAHNETLNPFVLICVDIERKIAYWILLDEILFNTLKLKPEQKRKVIHFPKDNVIDSLNTNYIMHWYEIYQAFKAKKNEVDYIKLRDDLRYFLGDKNEIKNSEYYIHIFLDELNDLLNSEFKLIKKIRYPYVWKMGFAYSHFDDDKIIYSLYPIMLNENDKQIKQILNEKDRMAIREVYGSRGSFMGNPIIADPKKHANSVIKYMNKYILQKRKLNLRCNEFINMEYSSHYIYANYRELNLDRYTNTIIDIIDSIKNILSDSFDKIHPEYDDNHLDRLSLGFMDYSFRTFVHSVNYLEMMEVNEVNNPYEDHDFNRIEGGGGLIFNTYSPKMLENSLKTYYENFSEVLKSIVEYNYPKISNNLNIENEATKIVLLYKAKDSYDSVKDAPWVRVFFLKSSDIDVDKKLEIYPIDPVYDIELNPKKYKQEVEFKGEKYTLNHYIERSAGFIYHEFPMFNEIYRNIEDQFESYFRHHHKILY